MKPFLILALVTITSPTKAQRFLQKGEILLFSFDTRAGKHVVLARDKENAYLVYRFGTKDSVEFEYPEKNRDSWLKFVFSYYDRGGGVQNEGENLNYVSFTNNGYRYSLYDSWYAEQNEFSVGISVTNLKTNKTVVIRGEPKTRKGTLRDFRGNNWLKVVDVLDQ